MFNASSAKYLFKADDPLGHLCTTSWNKLFGSTRCGLLNDIHKDSDRFVWRRSQSCVIINSPFAVGEVPNCPEADYIELAAYAYDNYLRPFDTENQGTLLKIFDTKVKVNKYYGYRITVSRTSSLYELIDDTDNTVLETKTIDHRDCGSTYNQGTNSRFYFGGQCPAPVEVNACYDE